jgi:daunorubicin resistance ABC transporter ATP-binding subunit
MSDSAILVEDLHRQFGDVRALDGIDFEVPPGSVFGLLGPNGAGKTTAVRVLTTILLPDRGRARVLGHDVVAEPELVRTKIGLAGQYAAVDENLTGRENLRIVGRLAHMSRAAAKVRADDLLERFGLTDAASRPVKTYSGGMRRRLDLAAALVHRPPVLFLDEPTTGLDPASRVDVWEMVQELVADGTTVLLTTQYLEEADRLAEQLVVIDQGKVIASGSPAQLKKNIGATVIDIGFSSAAAAKRAAKALEKLASAPPLIEGRTVELNVHDGSKKLIEVLPILSRARLRPTTLSMREPSLDDVFLALTGHKATIDVEGDAGVERKGAA